MYVYLAPLSCIGSFVDVKGGWAASFPCYRYLEDARTHSRLDFAGHRVYVWNNSWNTE